MKIVIYVSDFKDFPELDGTVQAIMLEDNEYLEYKSKKNYPREDMPLDPNEAEVIDVSEDMEKAISAFLNAGNLLAEFLFSSDDPSGVADFDGENFIENICELIAQHFVKKD